MRTGTMTLQQAITRAGATRVALRPDGHVGENIDALLRHCGRPMEETLDPDTRRPVRYVCRTCGTDITHIDGHGSPSPISRRQRAQLEDRGELWTVGQNTSAPLNSRGAGGTSHD